MADERYVIDIILKARDETAAAFASAIGGAKALERVQKDQIRSNEELKRSYKDMTTELGTSQSTLDRTLKSVARGSEDVAQKMVTLEDATKKHVRTVEEHGKKSAQAALALGELVQAENNLADALEKAGDAKGKQTAKDLTDSIKRIEQVKRETNAYIQASKAQSNADREAAAERAQQMREGEALANEIEQNAAIRHRGHMERLTDEAQTEKNLRETQMREGEALADEIETNAAIRHRSSMERIANERKAEEEKAEQQRRLTNQLDESDRVAGEAKLRRNDEENAQLQATLQNRRRDAAEREQQQQHELGLAQQYAAQIQTVANLERQRTDARRRGAVVEAVKLDIDTVEARRKAEATAAELRAILGHIESNVDLDSAEAVAHAEALREMFKVILKDLTINVDVDAGKAITELAAVRAEADSTNSSFGGLLGVFKAMAEGFNSSSRTIASFDNFLRGLMSLGIAAFFNQLILLAGAAASALLGLASSAAVAGAALGGALVAGIAQAIPAVGLLAAAFSRISAVFAAAKQAQLLQQQQSYQGEKQNKKTADTADAVRSAEERLADANRRVTEAQKNINTARQEGIDKLQELILAERGLTLGMDETEAAIRKAAASGTGNLDRLFLQRDETQQRLTTTHREISQREAMGPGQSPELAKAQEQLRDAQRSAADAERGLEKAKRGSDIAASGVTAASGKLDFLLGRLSGAERHLYETVTRLQDVWRKFAQTATEPLIKAFDDALKKITGLLQNPAIINAAKGLASGLATEFTRIFDHFSKGPALQALMRIIDQSKGNLKPLTDIAINIGDAFLSIAEAAGPALGDILDWLKDITDDIAKFFESGRKSGDLQKFFKDGVTQLKAWGDLLWAVIQLFAAIAGPGGGAKSGLQLIQDIAKAIRGWADAIKDPDSKLHEFFQRFFRLGRQMLDVFVPVFGALASEFDKTFSKDGVKSVEGFTTFLTDVLIPAVGDFARLLGNITGKIGEFARAHPGITKLASALLAGALATTVFLRAGALFGPFIKGFQFLLARIGLFEKLGSVLRGLFGVVTTATGVEAGPLAGIAGMAAPIAIVVAAIVGLLALSGTLDDVWRKLVETGKRVWKEIQPGIKEVKDSIQGLVDQWQKGGGLVDVLKFIGRVISVVLIAGIDAFGDVVAGVFNGIARILAGFITILTGIMKIFRLDFSGFGDIFDGIKKIFRGMGDMIWGEIKGIGGLFITLGKDILDGLLKGLEGLAGVVLDLFVDGFNALMNWLGIASPSKLFASVGEDIIHGLWEGIKGLTGWLFDQWIKAIRTEIRGVTAVGRWIYNAIRDSLHAAGNLIRNLAGWVWDQIVNTIRRDIRTWTAVGRWIYNAIKSALDAVGDLLKSVGGWVWDKIKDAIRADVRAWAGIGTWIVNAIKDSVSTLADSFKSIGKTVFNFIVEGFKSAPALLGEGLAWIIDHLPVPNLFGWKGKVKDALHLQEGGAVPGAGSGDIVPAMLEPGEHVWTKAEVAAAGGHAAMYALRAFFGGGTQARGSGMQEGGQPHQAASNLRQGFYVARARAQDARGDEEDQKASNKRAEVEQVRTTTERSKRWQAMWTEMVTATRRATNEIEKQVRDMRVNTTATMDRMLKDVRRLLDLTVTSFGNHGEKLVKTWTATFNSIGDVTYQGLKYIQTEANSALEAVGGKKIDFHLKEPNKDQAATAADLQAAGFASGGMVGYPGERGGDRVAAVLGRGEAVLNWAHQKVVNSALWNQYGMTLDGLFNRTDSRHAGGQGYARGGYTGPGHSGEGFTPVWNMAQSKFGMTNFTGFDGHSRNTTSGNVSDHFYHRALDMSNGVLTAQEDALNSFFKTKVPQVVKQLIWRNVDQFKGYPIPGHEDHVHLAMPDQFAFDGSLMAKILSRATRGLSIAQLLASAGTGAPAVDHVMRPLVEGKGFLRSISQRVLDRVRNAVNKFIDAEALKQGGGSDSGPLHDPNLPASGRYGMSQLEALWKGAGGPSNIAHLMAAIAMAESGGDPSINYGGGHNSPAGPAGRLASGLWQILGIPNGYDGSKVYDPFENAKMAVAKYNSQGLNAWQVYSRNDYQQYLGRGGFAGIPQFAAGGPIGGQEGAPVGIVAHAGEWVLNRLQQARMSNLLGVSSEHLKRILGFGGVTKGHFADGGEVLPDLASRQKSARKGQYVQPIVDPTDIEGAIREINLVNTTLKNLSTKGKIGKQLDRFLKAMNELTKEGGRIDDALAKIEEQGTRLQRGIDLAAVGLVRRGPDLVRRTRITTSRFAFGGLSGMIGADRAPTTFPDAVAAADATIKMHQAVYKSLRTLRTSTEGELADTEKKIAAIEEGGVTKGERDRYDKLIFSRGKLNKTLDDVDDKIATNRQSMYEAQVDRFSKQTEALLKPSTRAGAVADLGSRISSIFGREDAVASFGTQQLAALQGQQTVLQRRLGDAQQKAKKDPRWQTVADDIQKQLDDLSANIAEQTHANLQGQIEAVNSDISRRQTTVDLRRRVVTALGQTGELPNLAQQSIGLMNEQIGRLSAQLPGIYAAGDAGLAREVEGQIAELQTSVTEATVQMLHDAVDQIEQGAQRSLARIDVRGRLTDLRGRAGDRLGAAGAQVGLQRERTTALANERTQLLAQQAEALRLGGVDSTIYKDLTDKISDLDATIAESDQTTQDLIVANRQLAVEIIKSTTERTTGLIGSAQQIVQGLGQLAGYVNPDKIRPFLLGIGMTLVNAAAQIVQTINDTLNDPDNPFGLFADRAEPLLAAARDAFQAGPEAFADWLLLNAPGIAKLVEDMGGASSPMGQFFNSLIDSMVDNTTATISNTDQINQLTAGSNAQSFSSSLWTMFRTALFSGSGTILPQFQSTFPAMQNGGFVHRTGLYQLHVGETVVPAGSNGDGALQQNLYITNPTEVADPDYIFSVAEFKRSNRRAT